MTKIIMIFRDDKGDNDDDNAENEEPKWSEKYGDS